MNAFFFGLKRSYWSSLRVTRHAVTKLGLTAARLDMLYALRGDGAYRERLQSQIRNKLGVSGSVVSRMLKSLEELGLVVRKKDLDDKRQRRVIITKDGRRALARAIRMLIDSDWAQLVVDTALAGRRWYDDWACLVAMDQWEHKLRKVRARFGDTATLYYPWHPDD